ncbi:Crp/Fnr family transcriptional regulator [Patescibacteria group bacterium]|nr:Crp/Fnr family transcriptional regulator [Patescibacteria group bacterium]
MNEVAPPISFTKKLHQFFNRYRSYPYKKGEIILRAQDSPSGVYYIEQGFIRVYSFTEDGEENLHLIYKEGEIFPLVWVYTNSDLRFNYEAMTDVVLWRANKEDFIRFVDTTDSVAAELIRYIMRGFDIYSDRVDNLSLRHSYARLISRLLFLAKNHGKSLGDKITFEIPITQKDLASAINATRETVNKNLNTLKKKKLITINKKSITIRQPNELEKELIELY